MATLVPSFTYCFFFFFNPLNFNFQGISFKSAKKKKGMTVGFVSFESVEQLKSSVEVCFASLMLYLVDCSVK